MAIDRFTGNSPPEQPKTEPVFNLPVFPDQINQLKNNENGIVDFLKKVYEEDDKDGKLHKYEGYDKDLSKKIIEYVVKNQDKIHSFLKNNSHSSFKDESQQSQFFLDLLKSTSSDSNDESSKEERSTFIYNLMRIDIYNIISFSNETDKKNKNFFEKIYFKNSDFMLPLIDNKDKFFDKEGNPNSNFYEFSLRNDHLSIFPPENLSIFSGQDKAMWSLYKDLYSSSRGNLKNFFITNRSKFSNTDDSSKLPIFLNQDQDNNFYINSHCIEALFSAGINFPPSGFLSKKNETLEYFFDKPKPNFPGFSIYPECFNFFRKNSSHIHEFLSQDQDHNFYINNHCLESIMAEEIHIPYDLLSEKNLASFSDQDKAIWTFVRDNRTFDKFIIENKDNFNKYIVDNKYTLDFFNDLKIINNNKFIHYFEHEASKKDWVIAFGKDTIDSLLDSLPKKTSQNNEARNAFTHNEYDRTSLFFNFLIGNPATNFVLDKENIIIASAYIKKFKLSTTPIVFRFFKNITQFNNGKITSLPPECADSNITTIDQLQSKVDNFRKQCLGSKPFENFKLSPLELDLLSVATGHSSTQWSQTPIETIVNDFSKGNISPLSPEFIPSSTQVDEIRINNTVNLKTNEFFQATSQEVLNSIKNINTIDDLKKVTTKILKSKITNLEKENSNDYKQIELLNSDIKSVGESNSIDSMIKTLISIKINFDNNRDRYSSILRQLVFRKVLQKHNTSNYHEKLKNSLEKNPGVLAVIESSNFLKNLVEDHALNLTNNEEKYWDEDYFEDIKNNEEEFKKNLDITSLTEGLDYISSQFETINLQSKADITMIPDRGLTGELAGYMANVCYTAVYPLLEEYPNVIPYKFVSSPESDNPEIIGSTLVFQIKTKKNEPVLLIRAFDVPDELTLNIGQFFENFVDSLSQTAKELGINKIIVAGTDGTISNYEMTKRYVIDKYVSGHKNIPLKEKFDFNENDITDACYLVRDLTPKKPRQSKSKIK